MADCTVVIIINQNFESMWKFDHLLGAVSQLEGEAYNIQPMIGNWTFRFTFCETMRLFMGQLSKSPESDLFGWSFGYLTSFKVSDAPSISNVPQIQFVQTYSFGDMGAPCVNNATRTTKVNIYCGNESDCSTIPYSKGPNCIGGNSSRACICGIYFNQTLGMCGGLTLNVLSNNCPAKETVPVTPIRPVFPDDDDEDAGQVISMVFLVLFILLVTAFFGGYLYNYSVHAKRGCAAIPFYSNCSGNSSTVNYDPVTPVTGGSRTGYGSLT